MTHLTNTITVFKSMSEHATPNYHTVEEVLGRIKRGGDKKAIDRIHAETDKPKRDKLKKTLLPWICFSGKFTRRLNDALLEHSGLMCLDFDGIPKQQVNAVRSEIDKDQYTFASFISPSGIGIKALVKVPPCKDNAEHNRRFEALSNYYAECGTIATEYFDNNVKGVNRVCFGSYDPHVYINNESDVFTEIIPEKEIKVKHYEGLIVDDSQKVFNTVIIGWAKKYPDINFTKGSRNSSLYRLAGACVDYIPDKNVAEPIVMKYLYESGIISSDFTETEAKECIHSAYSRIPSKHKLAKFSSTIDEPNNNNTEFTDSSDIISDPKPKEPDACFWKWKKNGYEIDFLELKRWLQDCGFFRYELNTKDFVFVRIIDNTVEEVDIRHIKDYVLKYLEDCGKEDVYNMVAGNSKFRKDYLNHLDPVVIRWARDTKNEAWVYYRNTAVKIDRKGLACVPYIDLNGFIWKSQKLDRDFEIVNFKAFEKADFARFIANLCNKDKDRIKSFITGMGYLLHSYKDMSVMPAVIFNDEILSSEPCGGSGKGLTMKAIGEIKKTVVFDGKNLQMNKSFLFQRVDLDTQVMLFDDVSKSFKFEKLFSIITEGIGVEKKNKQEIYIPFKHSPKVAITTNYVLKGSSTSHNRRKFELELFPHYSEDFQPIDDFGRAFFDGWDEQEYVRFDNFMLNCLRTYLEIGLIKPKYENLAYKRLIGSTSEDFIEFANEYFQEGGKYKKIDYYKKYKDEYDIGKNDYPNSRVFYQWMKSWGDYNKWDVSDNVGGGKSCMVFGIASESEEVKDELPF